MKNVICYINQFFAGIGGEDKADYTTGSQRRRHGPHSSH
ncbi:MAG: glycine/sarcosine/betaine reductase selenoprotein B family protein [Enterocloster clostridioformis]